MIPSCREVETRTKEILVGKASEVWFGTATFIYFPRRTHTTTMMSMVGVDVVLGREETVAQ